MKFGFDHVHLVGSDLDASERFYQEMFGAHTIARASCRTLRNDRGVQGPIKPRSVKVASSKG